MVTVGAQVVIENVPGGWLVSVLGHVKGPFHLFDGAMGFALWQINLASCECFEITVVAGERHWIERSEVRPPVEANAIVV